MLAKLVDWLRRTRGELNLMATEQDFDVVVGDARLHGRVDRLERDADGRAVVIDLKTGKSKADDPPANPQLGAYQFAVESGGFGESVRSGGARLVQLGTDVKSVVEQGQPPLDDDPRPGSPSGSSTWRRACAAANSAPPSTPTAAAATCGRVARCCPRAGR